MINTLALRNFTCLANDLDSRGLFREADYIDRLLFKIAIDPIGSALNRAEELVGSVQRNIAAPAGKAVQTLERGKKAVDKTKKIAIIALSFVGKIFSGANKIGDFIEGTKIPGFAFIGTLLKIPSEALKIIQTMKTIWAQIIYPILSKKVGAAKGFAGSLTNVDPRTGKRKACLSLGDIAQHKDKILMFVSLITGPIGATIIKALNLGASLMRLDPKVSDLKVCLGLDLKAKAKELVTDKVEAETNKYKGQIEALDLDKIMAGGLSAPRRDMDQYGARLGRSMTA